MYLISASKVKRLRDRLDSTRPYFEKVNEFMKDLIFAWSENTTYSF